MGLRGTLVLALLVVLGIAYLWVEGPPPASRQPDPLFGAASGVEPTHPITRLLEFSPDEITQIALSRAGRQLVARRTDQGWTETIPPGVIADFLHNLTGLGELMRLDAGPDDLLHYGLNPPQAEIELTRRSGPPLVLLIGDRNPPATCAYVRLGRSGPVVLAGALVVWEFDKAFKALGGP